MSSLTDTIKKMKRQAKDLEKIFATHTPDKSVPQYIKTLTIQLDHPVFQWSKYLNRQFPKEAKRMTNKQMKDGQ